MEPEEESRPLELRIPVDGNVTTVHYFSKKSKNRVAYLALLGNQHLSILQHVKEESDLVFKGMEYEREKLFTELIQIYINSNGFANLNYPTFGNVLVNLSYIDEEQEKIDWEYDSLESQIILHDNLSVAEIVLDRFGEQDLTIPERKAFDFCQSTLTALKRGIEEYIRLTEESIELSKIDQYVGVLAMYSQ